jgi:RimJ/RimL family protein N-acetyltransferase
LGEPPHAEIEDRVAALAEPLAAQDSLRSQATRLTAAVDGLGTWRIVSAWEQLLEDPPASEPGLELELVARSAAIDDARILFDWRNDRTTREASRDSEEVEWNPHLSWLTRTLADEARRLLVIESAGVPVATCRWDHRGDADWEVSITVAPHARGRGLASGVLTAAERALDIPSPVRMLAVVRAENEASTRLFRRAGYLPHLPANPSGFLTSAKWRLAAG